MSAGVIQARYADLEAVAARFGREGLRVQEVTRDVVQRASVLRSGGWEGRGLDAFLAEVDGEVTPALQRLNAALQEAQRTATQMRQVMYEAEEEAGRLFGVTISGMVGSDTQTHQNNNQVNAAIPSVASRTGVIDTRPPWREWLGDHTPLAFIPGFTPPVGGDLETIDDRLEAKFGRDVNLVDGNEKWTDYEAAAVDRAVANLPPALAAISTIRNIYRVHSPGSGLLAFWVPPGYDGSDDGVYEQQSITFMSPFPVTSTRQGSSDAGERLETVVFHELVHSAQFRPDGQHAELTKSYLDQFGWSPNGREWVNGANKGPFPGTSDSFLGLPVVYPEKGRTGMEDMADAVTYYRYEPETLKRESPERYAWIRDNVFNQQEF